MGGVKVLAFAYRNWAIRALTRVVEHRPDVELWIRKEPGEATAKACEEMKPDLVLFYGWSWIVPDEVVDNWLCICLHPSPLPKYRGGSPIQHQIINGEKRSRVTFFRMTRELDAGAICAQASLPLSGTLSEIFQDISEIAIIQTLKFIKMLEDGKEFPWHEQTGKPTIYRRRRPADSMLTQEELGYLPAQYLHDKIRALTTDDEEYPAAFITCADGEKLYLTGSRLGAT